MAPHRGSDLHTGTLARQLFDERDLAAAAWNSAPRKRLAQCPAAGDAARAETHYLTAFSLAFAQVHPAGRVVQLHGFDAEKYLSSDGYAWDAVLSNGTRRASGGLQDLAACLRVAFPGRRIAVFPQDIGELGATANAQGQALRDAGFGRFVHLELSLALRQQLAGSKASRARLAACLEAGL